MAEYAVNKGIGRSPEFQGLTSRYLFVFAGGLLGSFLLFVVLYTIGLGQWICIASGAFFASASVWITFRLNARYGEWGLLKLLARRKHPNYIVSRKRIDTLFVNPQNKHYEKYA